MKAKSACTLVKDKVSRGLCCKFLISLSCSLSLITVLEERVRLGTHVRSLSIKDFSEEYVFLDRTGAQIVRQAQIMAVPFPILAVITIGVNVPYVLYWPPRLYVNQLSTMRRNRDLLFLQTPHCEHDSRLDLPPKRHMKTRYYS